MIDTSARLLQLLSVLQSRGFWPGQELAERLDVTSRTLRRDVERVRALGYVVESTSGPGGGYRLGKGTRLPPLMLQDDEAVALVVALRTAVDSFARLGEVSLGVLAKLDQILPARLRSQVGALISMTVSVSHERMQLDPDLVTLLATACRDREVLRLSYLSPRTGASERDVEPMRLAHTGGRRWYLLAWDRVREDWRTFRVDRIQEVKGLSSRFTPREPPKEAGEFVQDALSSFDYGHTATLRLTGSHGELSQRIPRWVGALEPIDETHCLMRTSADSIEGLLCQLILTRTGFELLEPTALRSQLREALAQVERSLAQ